VWDDYNVVDDDDDGNDAHGDGDDGDKYDEYDCNDDDDDDDYDDDNGVSVKVWLCVSGADHYLRSHAGLYQQILSRPRNEHLVELINTGKLMNTL